MANIFKNNGLNYFILFIISLLTLNYQDHSVNAGLDGSYFWAFNYLISQQWQDLDKITFIYGPLAFLHNTMAFGTVIVIGTLFQIILKFVYGIALFKLAQFLNVNKQTVFLLFGLSCLTVFGAETYLNLVILLFLIIHHYENKNLYLYLIGLFTIIGYYFKCSIGLSGAMMQGLYFLYLAFSTKKIDLKLFFKIIGINVLFFVAIGMILFRSLVPVFDSLVIYYQNIIMFNESSSIYNGRENIILLVLCFVALIAIFYYNKHPQFKLFWLLAFFFLYTGYTHSIVRMDHSHYMGFLVYLYMIFICCGLFYDHISKYTFPLLGLAFFSYYGNLSGKKDFSEFFMNIPDGPGNFYNYVLNNPQHVANSKRQTALNFKYSNKLSAVAVHEINKGTVDFFPWDLGYITANKISHWQPRPYLQNLNMSGYFDKKTAAYFKSDKAPERLVWHEGKTYEFMGGIDNSYLPNNEFHSIISIFSNYQVVLKEDKALLLKRKDTPNKLWVKDISEKQEVNSGEWIQLPNNENVLGCSITYDFNMLRGLKKQFYRDDEFFIEYRTATKQKFKKRIWPNDAKDFIWLNPYIYSIKDSTGFKEVTEVRFTNTNKMIHSGKLTIQFKTLVFETPEPITSKTAVYKWFNP